MIPPRSCPCAGFLWLLACITTSVAVEDPDQVVFHDASEPSSGSIALPELPDLLQNSIWLEENKTDAREVALYCCTVLNTTLPGKVFFPDSEDYQSQEASYYSQEQSELKPTCRVSPASAVDVSAIVTLATKYDCEFAVRSGGHMHWKASSNVGPTGFTIDLQKMNQVSVSVEQNMVSFGAGCRWHEVYSALKPYNLTTVGGRVPDVGVSGFLLGGGISVLSPAHGFGSSNILNYQVVACRRI